LFVYLIIPLCDAVLRMFLKARHWRLCREFVSFESCRKTLSLHDSQFKNLETCLGHSRHDKVIAFLIYLINYIFLFKTNFINPLKTKCRPLYLNTPSVPRSKHFHLGYKNQSFYGVSGTSRCLFSDKYETHKYSVGRAHSCLILNCWCIT